MLLTEQQRRPKIFLKAGLPVTDAACAWSKIVAKTFASAGKAFMTEANACSQVWLVCAA